jgi:integration host factor subunit beta
MTKSEFVIALAQDQHLSHEVASGVVNTILSSMSNSLSCGDKIELRGFGSFKVKEYTSYMGVNPTNGEKVFVKPKKLPSFKASKKLNEAINGNRKIDTS